MEEGEAARDVTDRDDITTGTFEPSAHAVRLQYASRRCIRVVGYCCPSVLRCLRMLGYEQALALRGCTHLALWFSLVVSFCFCAAWFTEVIQLKCTEDISDKHDKPPIQEFISKYDRCLWEIIGIIVFFANFVDAARMIAHFDDDRQHVLKEKWRTLDALKVESAQVLQNARANVERLRGRLLTNMQVQFSNFVKEVFTIILPCLNEVCEHFQQKGHADDMRRQDLCELVMSFTGLCKGMLLELEQLSSMMVEDLQQDNPEVFDNIAKAAKKRETAATSLFKDGNSGEHMQLWDEWIASKFPQFSLQETHHKLSYPLRGGATRSSGASTNSLMNNTSDEEMSEKVAECALQPLEELLSLPDHFHNLKSEVEARTSFEKLQKKTRRRVGFGQPPRGCGECSSYCCIPYTMALVFRCICCPCRAWCCRDRGCCKRGLTFIPPKVLHLGCFWIQIHTKLHERILQGLLFSFLFCLLYAEITVAFFNDCAEKGFGKCSFTVFRKGCAFLALIFYVPALATCLYRIDRLDAVMETIETIWELEDIQRAVKAFDKSMTEVAEQVVIFKAITDRMSSRINIVTRFGGRMSSLTNRHNQDNGQSLMRALHLVTDRLNRARADLEEPETWFEKPDEVQDERKKRVEKTLRDLVGCSFGMSSDDAPTPQQGRASRVNSGQAGPQRGGKESAAQLELTSFSSTGTYQE